MSEDAQDYDDHGAEVPRWAVVSSLLISVAGIGVAIYLTVAHYTTAAILACSDNGTVNCAKVTTSPQSVIFGVPVAVLGLAFFVAMFGASLPRVWRSGLRFEQARLAATVLGMGMVVYLIYAELFEIHAICLWCTAVHALTFLLFVVSLAAYYSEASAPAPTSSR